MMAMSAIHESESKSHPTPLTSKPLNKDFGLSQRTTGYQ